MEDESSVEKLKRKLYARGEKPKPRPRRALHDIAHEEVSRNWNHETVAGTEHVEKDPKQILDDLYHGRVENPNESEGQYRSDGGPIATPLKKEQRMTSRVIRLVFMTSLLFFFFAAGIAGYFLIGGKNSVSCQNITIGISGPMSIASGKKLTLDVRVQNNNPVPMRDASLEVVFPKGSKDADSSSINLSSVKEQIGTIEMGENVRTTTRAILFGQEQTVHEIEAVVSFGIDDSNATFTCRKPHTIHIATSPVNMTVEGLEEISSGQEVEFVVHVTSNSEEVVPEQRLVVEYPFGFEYISASPEPFVDDAVWDFGDISPGMEKILSIRGVVRGQGTEARTVKFSFGGKSAVDNRGLDTVLQKVEHSLLITRPFLELDLALNKSSDSKVISKLGETINGVLTWKNTLPSALHNVEIDLVFDGIMLDKSSVKGEKSFFRSIDTTLTWTPQTTNEEFRILEPGEEDRLSFSFNTNSFQKGAGVENPFMNIECMVRARRISDDIPVPESLIGQAKKTILFDSNLALDAYALFGSGPFTNTGPHPPKVEELTTYTIVWEVSNSTNNVESATVKGVLPVYVNWLNTTDLKNGSIDFNPVTREVIWSLGNVPRGIGNGEAETIKAYFQVSTVPSVPQARKRLTIVEDIELKGIDLFTKNVLQDELQRTDTELSRDPLMKDVSGVVVD